MAMAMAVCGSRTTVSSPSSGGGTLGSSTIPPRQTLARNLLGPNASVRTQPHFTTVRKRAWQLQPVVIAVSFSCRYSAATTGGWVTRPTGAGSELTTVSWSHS